MQAAAVITPFLTDARSGIHAAASTLLAASRHWPCWAGRDCRATATSLHSPGPHQWKRTGTDSAIRNALFAYIDQRRHSVADCPLDELQIDIIFFHPLPQCLADERRAVATVQPSRLAAPRVEQGATHTVFPAQLRYRRPRLGLLQNARIWLSLYRDFFMRKPGSGLTFQHAPAFPRGHQKAPPQLLEC